MCALRAPIPAITCRRWGAASKVRGITSYEETLSPPPARSACRGRRCACQGADVATRPADDALRHVGPQQAQVARGRVARVRTGRRAVLRALPLRERLDDRDQLL